MKISSTRLKLDINLVAAFILLFLIACSIRSKGQGVEISSKVQQTVMGLQTGHSLEFRTADGYGIGSFYQSTNYMSFEQSATNYPFYGLSLSAPLTRCGNVQVLGQLLTGVVNQKFLIATPEIETRIVLTKFIQLGIGAGYRSRQAAVSARLIINTL